MQERLSPWIISIMTIIRTKNNSVNLFDEEFVPITPINFFHLNLECSYAAPGALEQLSGRRAEKYLLPDLSPLCDDEYFADVFMGWNEEGIELTFRIEKKYEEASYPDIV